MPVLGEIYLFGSFFFLSPFETSPQSFILNFEATIKCCRSLKDHRRQIAKGSNLLCTHADKISDHYLSRTGQWLVILRPPPPPQKKSQSARTHLHPIYCVAFICVCLKARTEDEATWNAKAGLPIQANHQFFNVTVRDMICKQCPLHVYIYCGLISYSPKQDKIQRIISFIWIETFN